MACGNLKQDYHYNIVTEGGNPNTSTKQNYS